MGTLYTVTVGPLASADDDAVSLSQKAAGAQYLVINGAKATGTFSASSICASQTPGGAVALTINGTLATTDPIAGAGGTAAAGSATVRFPVPQRIYITGGSDESGKTFTVVGTVQSPTSFGPGAVISEVITGPNASVAASTKLYSTIISITASAGTTGAITVGHSGTATLDLARRIIITSGGNDTGITFTLTGTDRGNNPQSEVITGASGAAASSVLSYSTVTSILTSGAAATTVIVGTNAVADSQWLRLDNFGSMAQCGGQVTVHGTANYTVQQTLEDPNNITNQLPTPTYKWTPATITWVNHPDSAVVAASATAQFNYAYTPTWVKFVLNSGSGYIDGSLSQSYQG